MYSKIAGTGHFLPEKIYTNADLEKIVDTNDEWIRTRTGIEQRHISRDDEPTSELAEKAARKAMEDAGVTPEDLDLIICGTTTPDQLFPNLSCMVQARLGVGGFPAIATEAACSGFMVALSMADLYVKAGKAKCALVIGAECLTKMIDWNDRTTCVLFGDGAGAVILKPSEAPGIISTHLYADGAYKDLLQFPAGVGDNVKALRSTDVFLEMKGTEVFKMAVKSMCQASTEAVESNGLTFDDIDWIIPHQANTRIIESVAKHANVSMDKVIVTVPMHGNTSAASIPLALDVARKDGRVKPGQTVVLTAFGGGFTWGSALIKL